MLNNITPGTIAQYLDPATMQTYHGVILRVIGGDHHMIAKLTSGMEVDNIPELIYPRLTKELRFVPKVNIFDGIHTIPIRYVVFVYDTPLNRREYENLTRCIDDMLHDKFFFSRARGFIQYFRGPGLDENGNVKQVPAQNPTQLNLDDPATDIPDWMQVRFPSPVEPPPVPPVYVHPKVTNRPRITWDLPPIGVNDTSDVAPPVYTKESIDEEPYDTDDDLDDEDEEDEYEEDENEEAECEEDKDEEVTDDANNVSEIVMPYSNDPRYIEMISRMKSYVPCDDIKESLNQIMKLFPEYSMDVTGCNGEVIFNFVRLHGDLIGRSTMRNPPYAKRVLKGSFSVDDAIYVYRTPTPELYGKQLPSNGRVFKTYAQINDTKNAVRSLVDNTIRPTRKKISVDTIFSFTRKHCKEAFDQGRMREAANLIVDKFNVSYDTAKRYIKMVFVDNATHYVSYSNNPHLKYSPTSDRLAAILDGSYMTCFKKHDELRTIMYKMDEEGVLSIPASTKGDPVGTFMTANGDTLDPVIKLIIYAVSYRLTVNSTSWSVALYNSQVIKDLSKDFISSYPTFSSFVYKNFNIEDSATKKKIGSINRSMLMSMYLSCFLNTISEDVINQVREIQDTDIEEVIRILYRNDFPLVIFGASTGVTNKMGDLTKMVFGLSDENYTKLSNLYTDISCNSRIVMMEDGVPISMTTGYNTYTSSDGVTVNVVHPNEIVDRFPDFLRKYDTPEKRIDGVFETYPEMVDGDTINLTIIYYYLHHKDFSKSRYVPSRGVKNAVGKVTKDNIRSILNVDSYTDLIGVSINGCPPLTIGGANKLMTAINMIIKRSSNKVRKRKED